MMRSLFSGVSGLKTHQTRMDVIGNNIANVNTTAYKSKSINFSDMLYQTTQSATAPNTENQTAGTNARQIGLGVKTGAINTSITTEGSSQSTGNPFDLKITGEAFFVVTDGTNQYFTRDGSFNVDAAGYLCMANTGYIVEGWTNADASTGAIIQDSVKPIRILSDSNSNYPASYTTAVSVSGIIDQYDDQLETKQGKIMNIQVLDDRGYEYNLKFGITPATNKQSSTKTVANTERKYSLPTSIEYDDASTYTVYRNLDTASLGATALSAQNIADYADECQSTDMPSGLYKALTKAADALATHQFGTNDLTAAIKVDDTFLTTYQNSGDLSSDDVTNIKNSTWYNSDAYVEYSGDTEYTAYDGTTSLGTVDITATALSTLYGNNATTAPTAKTTYNLAAAYTSGLIVNEKTYEDDTPTSYEFSTPGTTSSASATVNVTYSDISALLKMDGSPTVVSKYTTVEDTPADSTIAGEYKISLLGVTDSEGNEVSGWESTLSFDPVTAVYDTGDGSFEYVGSEGNSAFTVNLSLLGSNFSNVSFDMSDTSNVNNGGKSTIVGTRDDGRKVGTLTGVSIGQDGTITANYDNGMTKALAQISVATFANSMGLENVGDNLYQQTSNSGEFDGVGVDIKGSGTGYMTTGVLEMSNVDLATEFTNMITTQRGFQANSRIITTSDSLLEELVNLKR